MINYQREQALNKLLNDFLENRVETVRGKKYRANS